MIRIENRDSWFFNVGEMRMTNVRDWYVKNFPNDDLGPKLHKDVSFWDVMGLLNAGLGCRIYKMIGVGDSVIRERLFARLAELAGCDYDDVYKTWLNSEPA